jgi:formate dehydrogenase major subunit
MLYDHFDVFISYNERKHPMQDHTLLPEPVQTAVSKIMQVGSRVQPFSNESRTKTSRIRDAKVVKSVCPYCAVGCSLNVYVKDGRVIDIEGNPDSPINHGTLCPKGSATFQYTINPSRLKQVLYRAPFSDHWEVKSLEWAMEQIAQRIKKTRDETFVENLPDGREVNHTLGIASLGGATLDIEENYVMKKLFTGGLGIVSIENQARI